jgi:hypothetical protein
MKRSHLLLATALGGTLLAAYFAPEASGEVALSERTMSPPAAQAVGASSEARPSPQRLAPQAVDVLVLQARDADAEPDVAAVLEPSQWSVPITAPAAPPPVTAAASAAPPQAPPLPFRAMGRYVEDGQVRVFLQHNDSNLVVRVGDTIAEHYKVESLDGGTLTLRYLPLDQQQTIDVGSAN